MSRLLDVHNFIGDKLRWQQQVLHDRELTPTSKVIGCQLMHDLNVSKRGAWRSQAEIAKLLHINVRSVRRCMAELVAGRHLVTTPSAGRGHAIVYEALLKADILPAIEQQKAGKKSALPAQEKRTRSAGKADTGARPYLEEPIKPLSPQSAARAEMPDGLASGLVAVPAEIRAQVVSWPQLGEGWARSWLDFCLFNPKTNELHARSDFARGRIRNEASRVLDALGLTLGAPIGAR